GPAPPETSARKSRSAPRPAAESQNCWRATCRRRGADRRWTSKTPGREGPARDNGQTAGKCAMLAGCLARRGGGCATSDAITEQPRAERAQPITTRPAKPADGAALIEAAAAIDAEPEFLGVPGQPHPWAARPEAELRSLAESGRGVVLLATTDRGDIVG